MVQISNFKLLLVTSTLANGQFPIALVISPTHNNISHWYNNKGNLSSRNINILGDFINTSIRFLLWTCWGWERFPNMYIIMWCCNSNLSQRPSSIVITLTLAGNAPTQPHLFNTLPTVLPPCPPHRQRKGDHQLHALADSTSHGS